MKKINILNQVSCYLVYLLPFALLTGQFLTNLFSAILTINCLFLIFIQKKFKYILNKFFIIFLLFCFIQILSSLLSDFTIFSLKSSLLYFRFGVMSILIWYLIDHNKDFIIRFYYYLLFAFILAVISAVYQLVYLENFFGLTKPYDRLLLLFSENTLLGQYLARMFPLLFALLMYLKNVKLSHYLFIFSLFVVLDVVIYISGERTALGITFVSTIFILLFISRMKIFRITTIIFSISIIAFLTFNYDHIKERNIDTTINQLGLNQDSGKLNFFSPQHESIAGTSMKIYFDNKLFGIGPNNFRNFCQVSEYNLNKNSCSTHPHHSWIQVITETGIIGSTFIIAITVYIIIVIVRHIVSLYYDNQINRLSDFKLCLIACFLCSIFPLLPSLNFYNGWISVIYYLPVGFYLSTLQNYDKE